MINQFKESNILQYTLIGILTVILSFFDQGLGLIAVLLFLSLVIYSEFISRKKAKKWQEFIEAMSSNIDSAAKYAVFNLPVPLAVLNKDGTLAWFNSKFQELSDITIRIGDEVTEYIEDIHSDQLLSGVAQDNCVIGERFYEIVPNIVDFENGSDIAMLYFFDKTDITRIKRQREKEKPIFAVISVDNIDEMLADSKDAAFISEIEKRISKWISSINGVVKKYSADKYLAIFENRHLDEVISKKFVILDEVREIQSGKTYPATLSIGLGMPSDTFSNQEKEAFACLELALGRGGDQAVLKKSGNFEFYGGKTKAVEKRTRVKARVIAHGIRSLVDDADKVLIMGHRYPDMDSFGSAIGMYAAAEKRNRHAYIVLNDVTDAISSVYTSFEGEDINYVDGETAMEMIDDDTLLVVVDTHKMSLTEYPSLVEHCDKVVVIDHHRRGAEFIDKAVVKYVEPYASSAAELVTEILQYLDSNIEISPKIADALLAGITLDTKNFTVKTGVRTFEAAGFLRKHGADSVKVRQLFQDDLETFIDKAGIVGSAERIKGNIAISATEIDSPSIHLIAAQAADDLLNIKGIVASFVIARKQDGEVFISGRSLGEVNVQVILEAIGGGGHLEVAGAQFRDSTVPEVRNILIESINKYFEEGDETK